MSFSSLVKKKLCMIKTQPCCRKAEIYGMLTFSYRFDQNDITLYTENEAVSLYLSDLLMYCFNIMPNIFSTSTLQNNKFTVTVKEAADRKKLIEYFGSNNETINHKFIKNNCCAAAFVRGSFLAAGTVIDPNKYYQLEISHSNKKLVNELSQILKKYDIPPKTISRKGSKVIYYKDSEMIEDFFAFIGAGEISLEIMSIKVYKDFRNKANRITNCETANISKTVKASYNQLEAIEHIKNTVGLDTLSQELKQVAKLRLEHKELSLKELGSLLSPPLSRSGVHHRLQKIIEISREI